MTLYGICMIVWKRDVFWCSGGFKNVGLLRDYRLRYPLS